MPNKQDSLAADFYQNYIRLAPDENVVKAIRRNTKNFRRFLKRIPKKKVDFAYAEGKWTIRELLQHIIDGERVFAYRALTFARQDKSPLPSFDENAWVINSKTGQRNWADMIQEFKMLRAANELLFESFDDGQFRSIGTASNKEINVLALGYILAGHVEHHMNIIRERYLKKNVK